MWTTRRASIHDKSAIAELCRAAVGPDDYVLPILDNLILRAVTYVALDEDRIIGTMTYQEVLDGSAWLSAARTDPAYRRKGIAMDLVQSLEGIARMKGLGALRLWTSATNRAGVASFHKAGFREVARFTRVKAEAARARTKAKIERLRSTEEVWARIEHSDLLAKTRGYVPHEWVFFPLTRATAHLLGNKGVLWGWEENGVLLTDVSETFNDSVVELSLLFGDARAILREAPGIAKVWGKADVGSFVPHDKAILEAARKAGFEQASWGREAILCEKLLDVAKVVRRSRKTYAEINAAKRSGYAALALLAPSGHSHGHTGPHEDRWNR